MVTGCDGQACACDWRGHASGAGATDEAADMRRNLRRASMAHPRRTYRNRWCEQRTPVANVGGGMI